FGIADEVVVHTVLLAGPRGPGGDRDRDPHLGVLPTDAVRDRAFPDRGWAGQDDETPGAGTGLSHGQSRGENSLSSAAICVLPSPRTRRVSAMPIRSITCRARTLPKPGTDCSRS